jgi:CSLREA domain-containing protein
MVLVGTLATTAMLVGASAATAAEIVVNTTSDHAPNGCAVSPGDCTLREAAAAANLTQVADTITVPAGNYVLAGSTRIQVEYEATIQGAGIGKTTIDAGSGATSNGIFFFINPTELVPLTYTVRDITLTGVAHADGNVIGGGGGLANNLDLVRVAVVNNFTTGGGGATIIWNSVIASGRLSLTESLVAGNSGNLGGAGTIQALEKTNLVIERSTITNNSTPGNAISVGNQATSVEIRNSTISGNTTPGFTVLDNSGKANFSYNTVVGNTVTLANQGVLRRGTPTGWTFKGNVVTGNTTSGTGGNCEFFGATPPTSQGFNFDSGTSCKFLNVNDHQSTPVALGPLQNNGGPTQTHALPVGSPAIDAGGLGGCTVIGGAALTTDQRGAPRPFGSGCDSGAFEFNPNFKGGEEATKPAAADVTAPTLTGAGMKPSKFKVDRKGAAETAAASKKGKSKGSPKGSSLNYTLSESASVLVTVESSGKKNNKGKGKKKGAKASKKKKAAKKVKASFTIASPAGATAHAFSGKIGKTTLKPGKYKATLVATDAAGNPSAAQTVSFTIVAR